MIWQTRCAQCDYWRGTTMSGTLFFRYSFVKSVPKVTAAKSNNTKRNNHGQCETVQPNKPKPVEWGSICSWQWYRPDNVRCTVYTERRKVSEKWSLELRRRKLIYLHNRWTNKNPYSGPRSDYIGLVRFSRWKLEHAAGTLLFVPFLAGVEKMRQEVAPRTRKKGILLILPQLEIELKL